MKRVLITGGTGFLGSYIIKQLLEREDLQHIVVPTTLLKNKTSLDLLDLKSDKINLITGDVRDFDFVQRMFSEYEFDTVFHLAAISEVRKCQNNAKLAFDTNITGTVNILEAARLFSNVKAVVVSSSDKAYGRCKLPYLEDYPLNGKSIYEVSKSCVDLIARSYFYNYDIPVVVTRCCNLYGGTDLNFSRVIPNTVKSILKNKAPTVWDGAQNFIREFLYVEDAANAYLTIAEKIDIAQGNAYNIGSGEKVTINDLVEMILSKFAHNLQIEYPSRSFPEIDNQYLDSSKIKRELGFTTSVDLNEGLEETIRTYKRLFEGENNDYM
jgi:CDP-glucose 4,6-dehydratase